MARLDPSNRSSARIAAVETGDLFPAELHTELYLEFERADGTILRSCESFAAKRDLESFPTFDGALALLATDGPTSAPLWRQGTGEPSPCDVDPRPAPMAAILRAACEPHPDVILGPGGPTQDAGFGSKEPFYVAVRSDDPVGAVQLGLRWSLPDVAELIDVRPGPDLEPGDVQSLIVTTAEDSEALEPGEVVIGLLLSKPMTVDSDVGADLLELVFEVDVATAGAAGTRLRDEAVSISVSGADGLGDPPIETVVTLALPNESLSARPRVHAGTWTYRPDATPPRVTCPERMVVSASGPDGATVEFAMEAEDASGVASIACTPESGSLFPIGSTIVQCVAMDGRGNQEFCSFIVEVIDSRPAERLRRGDSNDDGRVDISDALDILGYLFLGRSRPLCLDAADVNDDARVDISDASSVLGYLFLGGAHPAAPGPLECGSDATVDALGPCESVACGP